MEYHLKVGDADIKMVVDAREEAQLTAAIGEKEYRVSYGAVSENRIHMVAECGELRTSIDAHVADTADGKCIHINGSNYLVSDADALSPQQRRKSSGAGLPDQVTPPMPAVVISILVKTGDAVKKGHGVVVVSAMKMETTLMAPYDGRIKGINVAEGDKVAPGDILIDIEKSEELDPAAN